MRGSPEAPDPDRDVQLDEMIRFLVWIAVLAGVCALSFYFFIDFFYLFIDDLASVFRG